jgi:hypothetical protein
MRQALKLTSAGVGAFALYKAQSSSAPQPKCLAAKRDGVLAFGAAPAGAVGGPFGNPAHDWDYYQKCMVGGILSVRGGGGGAVLAPAALARPVFFHQPPTHKTRTHTTPI